MTLAERIGQLKAYIEYYYLDTFLFTKQDCQDIVKYLTELQAIKDKPPTDDWEHYADRLWVRAYECGRNEMRR